MLCNEVAVNITAVFSCSGDIQHPLSTFRFCVLDIVFIPEHKVNSDNDFGDGEIAAHFWEKPLYNWWKTTVSIPWYFLHPLAALILAQLSCGDQGERGKDGAAQKSPCHRTSRPFSPTNYESQACFIGIDWYSMRIEWEWCQILYSFLSPTNGCLHQHLALRLFWRPLKKSILKESPRFKV